MAKLNSREKFIPNGFQFRQPETGWSPPRMASFMVIVNSLIAHRNANPFLRDKHGWATDPAAVADEVEQYNVRICQMMGWTNYITSEGGGAGYIPKPVAPSQRSQSEVPAAAEKVRKIWAGVRTINDWLDGQLPAVPAAQAESRAAVCAACPKNEPGDFTRWFTAPASEAIKSQIAKAAGRKLATSLDDKLAVCGVCLCPLKLSVHVPLELKLAHLTVETRRDLPEHCWVIVEEKAK